MKHLGLFAVIETLLPQIIYIWKIPMVIVVKQNRTVVKAVKTGFIQ